ncbi:LamG domain-containing protein [Geminisphaera colitermitum]|uniref:LamG domain-containing protein n=1 Tax=Geminisphaera colitermitum TaxID=1148786 RepID=UPI000158D4A4|nr:LamG domain-containing protein [Geminisphaera colitermitum]
MLCSLKIASLILTGATTLAVTTATATAATTAGKSQSAPIISKEEIFVDYVFDPVARELRDRLGRQPSRSASGIKTMADFGGLPVLRPSAGKPVQLTGLDLPAGPLTLALWIRPDAGSPKAPQTIRSSNVLAIGIDKTNHYQITRNDDNRRPQTATATTPLVPDRWQHLVAMHDGATLSLYLDGKLIASTPCLGRKTSYSDNVEVLGAQSGGRNPFQGLIASYTVYNRALTSTEITTLARTSPVAH